MFLVRTRFVVARMAARTVRLVRWCLPLDDFGVRQVTGRTQQNGTVIEWLVSQAGVHVRGWNPACRVVAFIALPGGNEMSRIFSTGGDPVMAR